MATQKKASPRKKQAAPAASGKPFLAWESPLTVRKNRGREFFTTAGAILFLIMVILFVIKEWFLIIFLLAFGFYFYVMSTTPAQTVRHEIGDFGVTTAGQTYPWDELASFWFSEQYGKKVLNITRLVGLPRQLAIVLGDQKMKAVRKVMVKYLVEEAPKADFLDKSSRWLGEKVKLDK